MLFQRKSKFALGKTQLVAALLSVLLVLAMFGQFALPAMADTCTVYTAASGVADYSTALEVVNSDFILIGHNTTEGFEVDLPAYAFVAYVGGSQPYTIDFYYYVPDDGCTWGIQATFDIYYIEVNLAPTDPISIQGSFNTTVTTSGSYTGDSPATATNAANTAASDAAAAQTAANTAASNASTAATNASNAYTAANTAATNASTAATDAAAAQTEATSAANNTTYGSQSAAYWANNANTNAANAASYASSASTEATTAASQATSANTQAAAAVSNTTYNGQSAAYWADQAATAVSNNIVPVISSVIGVNGATCTTGTTFTANVAISPASSITYTVTGVPGYSASGNSITFTGLATPGAYTATITATYTPTGKTCTYPFTFFYIYPVS